ncbi:MAG TPA: HNH endonuclease [Abditibacterium sp.]|jgi:5-methylcytosine-specific restriction endonuclease McrA
MSRIHNLKNTHPPSSGRSNKKGAKKSSKGQQVKRDLATPAESDATERLSGVLVLNQNFEPLNICSIQRGITLMMLEKCEVLRFSGLTVRSAENEFLVPSVLRLNETIKRPMPELKISRKSVLARDSYTCVYCGSKESLTLDHVFPRHRGGETTWENVVCSCLKCNNKKGARTPSECGMRLPSPPRKPRYVPYISFPRFVSAVRRPEWREFLEGFGKGLEQF